MGGQDRIAVLGGGNGALTLAADLALGGHKVNLYELPEFWDALAPVSETGHIGLKGVGRSGTARLELVTSDIQEALADARVVLVSVPAFGAQRMAEACAPAVRDDHLVVCLPGTFGSVGFAQVFRRLGIDAHPILGDVATLPYGCRKTAPGEVSIFVEAVKLPAAAIPGEATPILVEALAALFPAIESGHDVVDVALKNINPCIHPGPCILNAGRIEYADDFYLYREGMTPCTRRVMLAIDAERTAVREALGYGPPHYGLDPTPGVYEVFVDYFGEGSIKAAGYNMQGPLEISDRYITEDIPYGLVVYSSLGELVGVGTPVCDSIITLGSVINETDHRAAGCTLESLGLGGLSVDGLKSYAATGRL
ncbi:MAG: NAD/NADP octopine/nopaline dehydrogenase family protein [Thermoleophilia bacterium]